MDLYNKLILKAIEYLPVEKFPFYLQGQCKRYKQRYRNPQVFHRNQELRRKITESNYTLQGYDDLKCIFVRIPKCATQSVSYSLFGNLGGGHRTIQDYQLIFSKEEMQSYFKFAFVRNPWDRLFSAFQFLKRGGFNETDRHWAEKNLAAFNSFDDFVCNWISSEDIWKYHHFYPQYSFICDTRKNIVMDFVGRVETIKDDFHFVLEKLNTERQLLFINQVKQSATKSFRDYYSEKSRSIVANVYKDDIELLGYTF